MDASEEKIIDEVMGEETSNLPEAPLSITIGSYYKGFSVLWTRRSADTKVSPRVGEIKDFIGKLIEAGYMPSWNLETNKASLGENKGIGIDLSIDGEKGQGGVCPVHNVKLVYKSGISKKDNKPYAFWGCPEKLADGAFCKAGTQRKV